MGLVARGMCTGLWAGGRLGMDQGAARWLGHMCAGTGLWQGSHPARRRLHLRPCEVGRWQGEAGGAAARKQGTAQAGHLQAAGTRRRG